MCERESDWGIYLLVGSFRLILSSSGLKSWFENVRLQRLDAMLVPRIQATIAQSRGPSIAKPPLELVGSNSEIVG